jgi:hypothetical protein
MKSIFLKILDPRYWMLVSGYRLIINRIDSNLSVFHQHPESRAQYLVLNIQILIMFFLNCSYKIIEFSPQHFQSYVQVFIQLLIF